jgi:hypothetical protein
VLEPKKHASIDLVFQPDTAVEGTVVGPTGEPLPYVCVYLWQPGQEEGYGPMDCTDDAGRFRVESMYPGPYFAVLNTYGKQTSREPYGRLFYPGTPDREQAAVILVVLGETIKDINIDQFSDVCDFGPMYLSNHSRFAFIAASCIFGSVGPCG